MQGTFFEVGLGACGKVNKDSDHIVAISSSIFGSGGNCDQVFRDVLFGVQVRVGWPADSCNAVHANQKQQEWQNRIWACARRVPWLWCWGYRYVYPENDLDVDRMVLTNAYTDMSPSLFQALGASLDEGVLDVSWHFEKKGFQP